MMRQLLGRARPWLVLLAATAPAVWYVVDHEDDIDAEFPTVARPTFSAYPPAAYRVAEPGDTLDRMGTYAASAAAVISAVGWWRSRRDGPALWPSALALSVAALWHAMNPGPLPDGWHGLGWRVMFDGGAPGWLRVAVGCSAIGLGLVVGWNVRRARSGLHPSGSRAGVAAALDFWREGRRRGAVGVLVISAVLVGLRQFDARYFGPPGYWPRWCSFWGLLAFGLALMRLLPARPRRGTSGVMARLGGALEGLVAVGVLAALILGGRSLLRYERPIGRLRAVDAGRIYISAMPDRRGLELAQSRHGFKTIINLFPEDTPFRSPHLAAEERFAREHGITYLRNTTFDVDPDAFLDATLALARDPASWPVLVHCHACMDRTPAWAGIYWYVERGRPLGDVMRFIEQHRGSRPKGSVTLMFARQLPRLAPGRFAADATGQLLMRCAGPALAEYMRRDVALGGRGARE